MDSLNQFLRRLKFEKNASINTIESYKIDLEALFQFTQKDLSLLSNQEIFDYIITLYNDPENPYNIKSIARKISCFRSFYKDLVRLELRSDNPMDHIDSPKLTKTLPHIVSEIELNKIFDFFDENEETIFPKLRDAMIFELLYSCGLRVSELCDLTINTIYLDEGVLRILGKGNKERLLPIGKKLNLLLRKYLPVRKEYLAQKNAQCAFLITSKFRKKVSRMFIWKLLKKYSHDFDVKELHPHMLRHAFATHMLSYGADIRIIQQLLGHSDLATTEIYTHVQSQELLNTLKEKHPFAHYSVSEF